MIEAHTLTDVRSQMADAFRTPVITRKRVSVADESLGLMTGLDMARPVKYQIIEVEEKRCSKLLGILFCHPNSPIGKTEVVDHLDYFHHRSGTNIDFFCAGYGAYWPPDHHHDQKEIARIDGVSWSFSPKAFEHFRSEIEGECSWRYSGESELLLLSARRAPDGQVVLGFDSAIVCNLEQMSKDGAFTSVRAFFENIFRFASQQKGPDPAWELSDQLGIKEGKNALMEAVLSLLPSTVSKAYRSARHFAIKDLSK